MISFEINFDLTYPGNKLKLMTIKQGTFEQRIRQPVNVLVDI